MSMLADPITARLVVEDDGLGVEHHRRVEQDLPARVVQVAQIAARARSAVMWFDRAGTISRTSTPRRAARPGPGPASRRARSRA